MSGLVTAALESLRGYTGSIAWGPFIRASRAAVLALLQQIEVGKLVVKEKDGSETTCGGHGAKGATGPQTELKILRETFWLRLALFADMVSPQHAFTVA